MRLIFCDLPEGVEALSRPGSPPTVYLARRVLRYPRRHQRAILAHELGHVLSMTFYAPTAHWADRAWAEARARRRALRLLVPDTAVEAALAQGITDPWALTELWDLPEPLCRARLELYLRTRRGDAPDP